MKKKTINILSLDGGGSKGVYTLGVLSELEKASGCKIFEKFDLIYGTSTGSIIASLLALGMGVDEIKKHYFEIIPAIMTCSGSSNKTKKLESFAKKIYLEKGFNDFKTNVGIVAMNYETQTPLIFKTTSAMAHGVKASFEPAFGVKIKDAVIASCSATPIFKEKVLETSNKGTMVAIDGGFIANNPTLFAIIDSAKGLGYEIEDTRVLSIGVGNYIEKPLLKFHGIISLFKIFKIVSRILNASSNTTEVLANLLFPNLKMVRINETFNEPQFETNMI
ncbi:MAG TPA: patatin-like phospholipase family protein, partial [Bacteroidia bacterium]|nr:patatin-like phospholipase family protein [Bacteroidia bacterium]